MQKYLKGISYPAIKDDLINCAKQNSTPKEIIDVIEQIANGEYSSPTDVTKQMKEIEN